MQQQKKKKRTKKVNDETYSKKDLEVSSSPESMPSSRVLKNLRKVLNTISSKKKSEVNEFGSPESKSTDISI